MASWYTSLELIILLFSHAMPFLLLFSVDSRLDTLSHIDRQFLHRLSSQIIRSHCAEQTWNSAGKVKFSVSRTV